MRRRLAVAVVLVALALVAWWGAQPSRPGKVADRAMPAPPVPEVTTAPPHPVPLPAPSDDLVNERAATEAAIAVLAAASGQYAVVCPALPDRDGQDWMHPEGASCAMTTGIVCAAPQPAGSVLIRRDGAPVAVYRWDTGQDGATTCVLEPPTEGRAWLRVLDEHAAPHAGVTVSTSDMSAFATTDTDGRATLRIIGTGTHWVIALGDDGAVSPPAGVVSGGTATLVLGDRAADIGPGDVMTEVRSARALEAVEDLEAALEPSLPPEVARELAELLDLQQRRLDAFCKTSEVPTCRAWWNVRGGGDGDFQDDGDRSPISE